MAARIEDLEQLYRERYAAFFDIAAAVTGDRETAHDAVQDGFIRAIQRRLSFRGEGPLEAWVWRIALRAAFDVRRGLTRDQRIAAGDVADLEVVDLGVPSLPHPGRDPLLAEALRRLPPKRRLIVFLRYFADLSYEDIAAVCAVKVGTVSASLVQARSELSVTLAREEVLREQRL
jgi:RNA polymerase sigma-70 factor (ECF subfamily)